MSSTSDTVWIVEEMLEEILGMVYSRDVQEKFEAEKVTEKSDRIMLDAKKFDKQMTHEISKVEKEHDWVNLIDEEMKELVGKCFPNNPENIIIEKKEEKSPKYSTMGFNWKEVEPIFKGQSEKLDNNEFRYVFHELIDDFFDKCALN